MLSKLKKKSAKAFTLIELVVVMAVIAILAGVSVGAYFGITNNANESATEQFAKQAQDLFTIKSVSDNKKYSSLDDMAADFINNDLTENGLEKTQVNYVMLDREDNGEQDILFVFNSPKWVCSVFDGRGFGELSDYYSSFEDMANDFAKISILEGYNTDALTAVEDKEGLLNFYQYGDSYLRKAIKVTHGEQTYFVPNGQTLINTISSDTDLASLEDSSGLYELQYYAADNTEIEVNERVFASFGEDAVLASDESNTLVYTESNTINIDRTSRPDTASHLNLASGTYQFMVTSVSTDKFETPHTYYAKDFNEFYSLLNKSGNNSTPHDIYVGTDAKIEKSVSLPSGSSIKLGWNLEDTAKGFMTTSIYSKNATSGSLVSSKLTVENGATLTINDGSLSLYSQVIACDDSPYQTLEFDYDGTAAAEMQIDGQVRLVKSFFDASGMVTSSLLSEEPRIFIDKSSEITSMLDIINFGGGTSSFILYLSNVFPFNKYAVFGLNVPFEMEAGGEFVGGGYLYTDSSGKTNYFELTLIGGALSSPNPIISVNSGTTKVYWEQTSIVDETRERLVFEFNGTIEDKPFELSGGGVALSNTMPFPFYNMGIIVHGSALFDDIKMKFLPGSYVKITDGSSIGLKTKAIFYFTFQFADTALYNVADGTPAAYLELPNSAGYSIDFGDAGFGGLIKGYDSHKSESVRNALEKYSGEGATKCFNEIGSKLSANRKTGTLAASWEDLTSSL